jgi:uncharacterized phage-associated protein
MNSARKVILGKGNLAQKHSSAKDRRTFGEIFNTLGSLQHASEPWVQRRKQVTQKAMYHIKILDFH